MSEVKRQHYVPRTYLKNFSALRNGEYFIKAVPTNAECTVENVIEMNIKNVCLEKNLYTIPSDDAEHRMLIEKFYSEEIETHYDGIYNLLIDEDKSTITSRERELIISTVITMLYRTTKWKNMHNELRREIFRKTFLLCEQKGKDYFFFGEEKIHINGKTLDEFYRDFITETKVAQMITQLNIAFKLIELRLDTDCINVVKTASDNYQFITCDHPVVCLNPDNRGTVVSPFDPGNSLILTIDGRHQLLLIPNEGNVLNNKIIRRVDNNVLSMMNTATTNYVQHQNAERFILGSEYGLQQYMKINEKWR